MNTKVAQIRKYIPMKHKLFLHCQCLLLTGEKKPTLSQMIQTHSCILFIPHKVCSKLLNCFDKHMFLKKKTKNLSCVPRATRRTHLPLSLFIER